ncbi:MAG: heme ABC exporter ATP-binding protein CcmA [Pseudomonadales bacterium]|nr:heme ABC exporter ATP-binding protein CcmA [Pseudomonadales bacterium]
MSWPICLPNLVSVSNLSCTRDRRLLFRDLAFSLGVGEFKEIRGPNGSGKSTLLRCIAGLFPDYEGGIETAPFVYVGHRAGVSGLLTPLENLEWFARASGSSGPLEPVLERVGLVHHQHVACQRLSAGQMRRAGLARLLISTRPLWLLDEPLTALDPEGMALVAELIGEHCASEGGVLAATHSAVGVHGSGLVELG